MKRKSLQAERGGTLICFQAMVNFIQWGNMDFTPFGFMSFRYSHNLISTHFIYITVCSQHRGHYVHIQSFASCIRTVHLNVLYLLFQRTLREQMISCLQGQFRSLWRVVWGIFPYIQSRVVTTAGTESWTSHWLPDHTSTSPPYWKGLDSLIKKWQ